MVSLGVCCLCLPSTEVMNIWHHVFVTHSLRHSPSRVGKTRLPSGFRMRVLGIKVMSSCLSYKAEHFTNWTISKVQVLLNSYALFPPACSCLSESSASSSLEYQSHVGQCVQTQSSRLTLVKPHWSELGCCCHFWSWITLWAWSLALRDLAYVLFLALGKPLYAWSLALWEVPYAWSLALG